MFSASMSDSLIKSYAYLQIIKQNISLYIFLLPTEAYEYSKEIIICTCEGCNKRFLEYKLELHLVVDGLS